MTTLLLKLKFQKNNSQEEKVKKDNIGLFKKEGLSALKPMSERELSKMIRDANDAYYCDKTPIMTDNEYDILREYLREISKK